MKTFNLKELLTNITNRLLTAAHSGISIQSQEVNLTISANSYTTSQAVANCKTVTNYSARCIVGWNVSNQASGANASFIVPYQFYINQANQQIHIAARNYASSQAKVTLTVFMLYTRNVA